jgi:hypothetical protein
MFPLPDPKSLVPYCCSTLISQVTVNTQRARIWVTPSLGSDDVAEITVHTHYAGVCTLHGLPRSTWPVKLIPWCWYRLPHGSC